MLAIKRFPYFPKYLPNLFPMRSRRQFLHHAAFSAAGLPLMGLKHDLRPLTSLSTIKQLASLPEQDYWKAIRLQFPLAEGQTYFNNGTLGPQPSFVLNKVIEDMHHKAVHAAETDYKGEGPQLLSGYFEERQLREKLGSILNADYKEIALTQNATFGMNFIGNGLDLKAGDELINTNQEHGGGFGIWQLMAKRKGCIYKQAKIHPPVNDSQAIVDAVTAQITSKTKVIAIPHIVSVYGIVMPIKEICSIAREKGIFTVIDGAQAVGQIKVDVKELGCDAYYSSLHKWLLAPAGNGLLYIRSESAPMIWTTLASYNWDHETDHGFRLMQYGTGNPSLLVGLEAAVDFYRTIGEDRWLNRIKELGDRLRAGLNQNPNISILSSTHTNLCAGITTYKLEGMTGPELQKYLWKKGRLQPRSVGSELLRHSVHIYNLEEEIDRALELLEEA